MVLIHIKDSLIQGWTAAWQKIEMEDSSILGWTALCTTLLDNLEWISIWIAEDGIGQVIYWLWLKKQLANTWNIYSWSIFFWLNFRNYYNVKRLLIEYFSTSDFIQWWNFALKIFTDQEDIICCLVSWLLEPTFDSHLNQLTLATSQKVKAHFSSLSGTICI